MRSLSDFVAYTPDEEDGADCFGAGAGRAAGQDPASSQNQQDVPSHRDNKPFIAAGFSMRLPPHELMRGDPFP